MRFLFVICGWCDRYLGTKEGSGISHGICQRCADKFYPELAQ